MIEIDEIVYNVLTEAKNSGNELLQPFKINYPSKSVAREDNNIFIAVVSSEPSTEMFETTEYRDMVEILIVTKIMDYKRATLVIKTVTREIIRLLKNSDEFPYRPVIRNIAPEYNPNFVLNKGHIMVECLTEIENEIDSETIQKVCQILTDDMIIEEQ